MRVVLVALVGKVGTVQAPNSFTDMHQNAHRQQCASECDGLNLNQMCFEYVLQVQCEQAFKLLFSRLLGVKLLFDHLLTLIWTDPIL